MKYRLSRFSECYWSPQAHTFVSDPYLDDLQTHQLFPSSFVNTSSENAYLLVSLWYLIYQKQAGEKENLFCPQHA